MAGDVPRQDAIQTLYCDLKEVCSPSLCVPPVSACHAARLLHLALHTSYGRGTRATGEHALGAGVHDTHAAAGGTLQLPLLFLARAQRR